MADDIASPSIKITGDTQGLVKALREGKVSLEEFTKYLEGQVSDKLSKGEKGFERYQKEIAKLAGELKGNGATAQLGMLAAAVEKLGGVEQLSAVQTENLANKVKALAAAGGSVPASLQNLTKSVSGLDGALQGAGLQQMQQLSGSLGPLGSVLSGIGPAGMVAAAGLGAAAIGFGAVTTGVLAAAAWADNIKDTATATGMTTESVQRLAAAAAASEVPLDDVVKAVLKMQRAMIDTPEKFDELGISMAKLRELAPEQQLEVVAQKLMAIQDPAERNALAISILGKSWAELAPLVMGGLDAMQTAAVMSDDTVDKLDKLHAQTVLVGAAWDKFKLALGAAAGQSPMIIGALEEITAALARLTAIASKDGLMGLMKEWATYSALIIGGGPAGWALANEKYQKDKLADVEGKGNPLAGRPNADGGSRGLYTRAEEKKIEAEQERQAKKRAEDQKKAAKEAEQAWLKESADVANDEAARMRERNRRYKEDTDRALRETERRLAEEKAAEKNLAATEKWATEEQDKFEDKIRQNLLKKQKKQSEDDRKEQLRAALDSAQTLGDAFGNIGGKVGGAGGQLLAGVGSMLPQLSGEIMKHIQAGTAGGLEKGIGSFLGGAGPKALAAAMQGIPALLQTTPGGVKGALAGASVGAEAGSVFGPKGAAAGALFGAEFNIGRDKKLSTGVKVAAAIVTGGPFSPIALGAVYGAIFESSSKQAAKQAEKMRAEFIDAQGGLAALQAKAAEANVSLDALFDAKNPEQFKAAVEDVTAAIDQQKRNVDDLAAAHAAVEEAAKRYGFTIAEMGPVFQQQKLDEMFGQLIQDQRVLTAAGFDHVAVLTRMAPAYNEALQAAIASGAGIPIAMKPAMEELAKMGLLVDADGNKLDNLDGVSFTATLSQNLEKLITKVDELVNALMGIPNVNRTVTITTQQKNGTGTPPPPPPLKPGDPGYDPYNPPEPFASGSGGLRDFGLGTLAVLHGREAVMRADQLQNLTSNSFDAGAMAARMYIPRVGGALMAPGRAMGGDRAGSSSIAGDSNVNVTIPEIHVHASNDPEATAKALGVALRNNFMGPTLALLRENLKGSRF